MCVLTLQETPLGVNHAGVDIGMKLFHGKPCSVKVEQTLVIAE
jgi:hypothetical protein